MAPNSRSASRTSSQGVALITGASEGFGRELARQIAADGFDLVLVARNEARLNELARDLEATFGIHALVRPADLADGEAQRQLATEVQRIERLAVLVNNAAVSQVDLFHDIPVDTIQRIVALNLGAVSVLSRAALNNRDFRRNGILLNVSSIGGSMPLPLDSIYSATKAAIDHLSTAIAFETTKNPDMNVHVQVAKLGGIRSEWSDRSMGVLKPGETMSKTFQTFVNEPENAAVAVWKKTKSRNKLMVADRWDATVWRYMFSLFPRLLMPWVYGNNSTERSRRVGV